MDFQSATDRNAQTLFLSEMIRGEKPYIGVAILNLLHCPAIKLLLCNAQNFLKSNCNLSFTSFCHEFNLFQSSIQSIHYSRLILLTTVIPRTLYNTSRDQRFNALESVIFIIKILVNFFFAELQHFHFKVWQ